VGGVLPDWRANFGPLPPLSGDEGAEHLSFTLVSAGRSRIIE
jgi:hypothetical protein